MQKIIRLIGFRALMTAFSFGCLMCFPGNSSAASLAVTDAVNCPTVQMKHWKESEPREKMAFLLGLASMLEMEREWQGDKPVSAGKSINAMWSKGLNGVTFGQMRDTLDRFVEEHPDQLDRSVIGVLGTTYVQPKLTDAQRKEAEKRYKQMHGAQ